MIYFCSAPIPQDFDQAQFQALQSFKDDCRKNGYFETFADAAGFSAKFVRQLAMKLNSLAYFKSQKPFALSRISRHRLR